MLKLKLMLSQILMADDVVYRRIGLTKMEKWAIGLGASLVIACVVALIV